MKRKIVQALLVFVCMVSMSGYPLTSYASDIEGTINEGEDIIIQDHGQSGITSNGATNNNTNTSSGESSSSTSGSTNDTVEIPDHVVTASQAQNSIRDLLKGYMAEMIQGFQSRGHGISNPVSNSFFQSSIGKLTKDDVNQLLSFVDQYNANYDPSYDGYCSNILDDSHATDSTDDDTATKGELQPADANYNSLDEESKKKIKKAIADKEGITDGGDGRSAFLFVGTDGMDKNFVYDSSERVPYVVTPLNFANTPSTWNTGFRTDLIEHGFNDARDWSSRFDPLRRLTSNAMADYLTIATIREYHIHSVQESEIEIIDYTSDVRKWVVTRVDHGVNDVIPENEILEEKITDSPRHDFTLSGYGPGTYYIIPAQEARYQRTKYVTYDICEYLFDADTQNLLYMNEKLVSNGSGGAVDVGTEETTGFVSTGNRFVVHINDLGEVETDGTATERVD